MLTIAAKIVRAKIPIQGGWVEPHHSKGGVKHQGGLRRETGDLHRGFLAQKTEKIEKNGKLG